MNNARFPHGPAPAYSIADQLRLLFAFNKDMMGILKDWNAKYGDTYYFEIGKIRQYIFNHPDQIHEILVEKASKFHKDQDYKHPEKGLARFVGNGILTSDGEFW